MFGLRNRVFACAFLSIPCLPIPGVKQLSMVMANFMGMFKLHATGHPATSSTPISRNVLGHNKQGQRAPYGYSMQRSYAIEWNG